MDTADYAIHARVELFHNQNPYLMPGELYTSDEPLASFMEAKGRPSVYGPVWQYISLLPGLLGGGRVIPSVLIFKVFFSITGLACLGLIWLFHAQDNPLRSQVLAAGVLVGWNPLLHLISHGEGHNDIVMAFLVAGMIVALAFQHSRLAIVAWLLSVLVKFVSGPLIVPLVATIYSTRKSSSLIARVEPLATGAMLAAVLTLIAFAPFGATALWNNVSIRYGGLTAAAGDSKTAVAVDLLTRVDAWVGIHIPASTAMSIVSLSFPVIWIGYTVMRGWRVREVNGLTKIAIESFLLYLTVVALPVYAQYAITPVVVAGFLVGARWHTIAVILISIALGWDSLLLVYIPNNVPTWETLFHQLSHLTAPCILVFYLVLTFAILLNQKCRGRNAIDSHL